MYVEARKRAGEKERTPEEEIECSAVEEQVVLY
jgi:hypothetical protein